MVYINDHENNMCRVLIKHKENCKNQNNNNQAGYKFEGLYPLIKRF